MVDTTALVGLVQRARPSRFCEILAAMAREDDAKAATTSGSSLPDGFLVL
jgi:hypothetical protein